MQRTPFHLFFGVSLFVIFGCRSVPPGEERERVALDKAGAAYSRPFEQRALPDVRPDSPYVDLLERALLADPDIEMHYFQWAAAVERAVIAGTPPDPVFGIGWMLTEPIGGLFNNILLSASQALPAPRKLDARARQAIEEARTLHKNFESKRFARKGVFRAAYADFDLAAREVEIAKKDLLLIAELERPLKQRIATGAASADEWLRFTVEMDKSRDALAAARAALDLAAAKVNVLMSRDPLAALEPPEPMMALALEATDEQLFLLSARRNHDIKEVEGRIREAREGVAVAHAENESDLGVEFRREGTDNMPMLSFSLPLRRDRVRAAIAEAEAKVHETVALRRSKLNDLAAETAGAITMFRESERRSEYYQKQLLPKAEGALKALSARFGAGTVQYTDLIEARRALLEIRRGLERARTEREKAVGDLLACCGADLNEIPAGEDSNE